MDLPTYLPACLPACVPASCLSGEVGMCSNPRKLEEPHFSLMPARNPQVIHKFSHSQVTG